MVRRRAASCVAKLHSAPLTVWYVLHRNQEIPQKYVFRCAGWLVHDCIFIAKGCRGVGIVAANRPPQVIPHTQGKRSSVSFCLFESGLALEFTFFCDHHALQPLMWCGLQTFCSRTTLCVFRSRLTQNAAWRMTEPTLASMPFCSLCFLLRETCEQRIHSMHSVSAPQACTA